MTKNAALDKKTIIRFILVYLALIGAMEIFLGLHFFQRIIDLNGIYSSTTAWFSAKLLTAVGIDVWHKGPLLHLPGRTLRIAFGCNGLEAVVIYGSAVLAFPASWKYKIKGLVYGLVSMQLLNLIRIAALGYTAVHFPKWFDYVHYYVAQGLMIAVALGIFVFWLRGIESAKAS